jgi:hypothetical protein
MLQDCNETPPIFPFAADFPPCGDCATPCPALQFHCFKKSYKEFLSPSHEVLTAARLAAANSGARSGHSRTVPFGVRGGACAPRAQDPAWQLLTAC